MDNTRTGYIYFIASDAQNAVKIGFAEDVYERHITLQAGNPDKLEVRAKVRATLKAEKAIHRLLKAYRIHLEWYPDNELIYSIMVELQDEALDRGLEWLAENAPEASDPDDISNAAGECPITAPEMTEIIEAQLLDYREFTGAQT